MSDENKVTCFEFFDCKELSCSRRDNLSLNCWEIDDVLCKSHSQGFQQIKEHFDKKIDACKLCMYYQEHNEVSI